MVINQGDIFWVDLDEPSGSEPGYRHPHVVIQNNLFNRSRINTVVVCALTSNLNRAKAPGNVLLNKGEANLPKKSVVNISQIFTVNKSDLSEKIGVLSRERFTQVLEGIKLLTEPREVDEKDTIWKHPTTLRLNGNTLNILALFYILLYYQQKEQAARP